MILVYIGQLSNVACVSCRVMHKLKYCGVVCNIVVPYTELHFKPASGIAVVNCLESMSILLFYYSDHPI